MSGTPLETALAFLAAGSASFKSLGFVDRFGDGTSLAPMHAPINTGGARVDPATSEDIAGLLAALALVLKVATQSNAPRVSSSGQLAAAYAGGSSLAANIAANAALTLAIDGMSTAVIQVAGTWVGTISWLGSIDSGVTYFPLNATPFGGGLSGPSIASTSTNGQFEIAVGALTHIQAQMTVFMSGSASVVLAAANGAKIARVKAPSTDPLPVLDGNNMPYSASTALTVGAAAVTPGRSLRVYADAAGKVSFKTSAGNTVSRYFNQGENEFAFAVTQILAVTAQDGSAYAGVNMILENEA